MSKNGLPIRTREAELADFPAIRDLLLVGDDYHRNLGIDILRPDNIEYTETDLQQALDRGDAIFLASIESTPAGLLRVGTIKVEQGRLMAARTYAMVHELVVADEYRQRGVGRLLMAQAAAWAKAASQSSLELSVFGKNTPAREFYERLGFAEQQSRLSIKL